ncbi:hypothetical protein F4604DRAFT_1269690 [Suillus subluteus]|nr:hypothetical protein F4604DRAFT_1269690 [Suillus subluteus]
MDRYGSHYLFPSTRNTLFLQILCAEAFAQTYPRAAFTLSTCSEIKRHTTTQHGLLRYGMTVTGYQRLTVSSRKHLFLNMLYHFHSFSLRLFRPLETLFIYLVLDAPGSVMSLDHASGVHFVYPFEMLRHSVKLLLHACSFRHLLTSVLSPIVSVFVLASIRSSPLLSFLQSSSLSSRQSHALLTVPPLVLGYVLRVDGQSEYQPVTAE